MVQDKVLVYLQGCVRESQSVSEDLSSGGH